METTETKKDGPENSQAAVEPKKEPPRGESWPKILTAAIYAVAIIIVVLLAFKIGITVGIKKANFSCQWSDNYHQNFGGPKGGFMAPFKDGDFIEANGTFGQIIKIENQTITIKGRDNVEKTILADQDTLIRRLRDDVKLSDLKNNDYIVIIGEPNGRGQIAAKFIRIMPPPPMAAPDHRGPMPFEMPLR